MPTENQHNNTAIPEQRKLSFREYAKHVPGVVWIDDIPWSARQGVLMPVCMPHVIGEVDRQKLREAMSENNALLAYWTTDWDRRDSSEWWWTCCDQKIEDIQSLPSSRGRRSIRKGLKECEVKILNAETFAPLAYPIYRDAIESYGETPPTKDGYANQVQKMAEYAGTEFWAAFYKEEMVAFATCQIIDNAVTLGSTKSDPDYNKYNPNAALFHTISQYYLDQGIKYVTNGSRTLWHPSNINQFLERLGFRKIYCNVNVELSPVAKAIAASDVANWGNRLGLHKLFGKRWAQLQGFNKLVKIANTCK